MFAEESPQIIIVVLKVYIVGGVIYHCGWHFFDLVRTGLHTTPDIIPPEDQ